jgi:small conductance mechanosensitive channel
MFFSTAYAAISSKGVSTTQEQTSSGISQFFGDFFHMIPLIIAAGIVFILSFVFARFIKKIILFRLRNRDLGQEVMILIGRTIYATIVTLGAIIAFNIMGLDLSSLIAFLGVGIGFALKDLLSNFIAGVMILTQKKFQIGDVVKVDDNLGKIIEIDARITQIQAFDGTNLIIPNAKMITAVIQNFTANSFRRIKFNVGVHYDTPLAESIQTALISVRKNQLVVPKPAVQVLATEFGDSAINLQIRFWIESTTNWFQVRSEIIQQLKLDFDSKGIQIPYPIQTITLDDNDNNLMKALNLPVKGQTVAQPTHDPAKI